MSALKAITLTFAITLALAATALGDDQGRIYGVITTVDGETLEGLIRWDKILGNITTILS